MKTLLAALLLCCAFPSARGQETTVIVVRHAERAMQPAADPVLAPAGAARAEALRDVLQGAGITHVLTTTLQRTRLTAAPIVSAIGIAPAAIDPRSANHVADVVAAVRARAGGVILVVGHSNTVPAIVNALGGRASEICDDEYDNLYVVTLPAQGGPARVVAARYGVPTPVSAGCNRMLPVSKE